jgi:hypothetical protein
LNAWDWARRAPALTSPIPCSQPPVCSPAQPIWRMAHRFIRLTRRAVTFISCMLGCRRRSGRRSCRRFLRRGLDRRQQRELLRRGLDRRQQREPLRRGLDRRQQREPRVFTHSQDQPRFHLTHASARYTLPEGLLFDRASCRASEHGCLTPMGSQICILRQTRGHGRIWMWPCTGALLQRAILQPKQQVYISRRTSMSSHRRAQCHIQTDARKHACRTHARAHNARTCPSEW